MTKAEKPPAVDSYELRAGAGPGEFLARVSVRGIDRASSALDLVVLAWTAARDEPDQMPDDAARALRVATVAARRLAAKVKTRVRVVEVRDDGKETEIAAVGPQPRRLVPKTSPATTKTSPASLEMSPEGTENVPGSEGVSPVSAFVAALPVPGAFNIATARRLRAPIEDWLDSDLAIAVELPELTVIVAGLLVSSERRAILAGDERLVVDVVQAYALARSWAWAGLRTVTDAIAVFDGRVAVAEGRTGTRMLEELIGPRPGTRGYAGPATLARFREDWRGWGAEYRTALLALHTPLLAAIRRGPREDRRLAISYAEKLGLATQGDEERDNDFVVRVVGALGAVGKTVEAREVKEAYATDEEKLWAAAWAIRRLTRREARAA